MNHNTKIEWTHFPGFTGETWNPVRGCSRASTGCENCYAEGMAARFSGQGFWGEGLTKITKQGRVWSGVLKPQVDRLRNPLRWRKPRAVFVNSTSDLFHEKMVQYHKNFIAAVFGAMAGATDHRFIILTKRAREMREWFEWLASQGNPSEYCVVELAKHLKIDPGSLAVARAITWPLTNVVLGVSVENQKYADLRIPELLKTPAHRRMISAEPLLGPVVLDAEPRLDNLPGPARGWDWYCPLSGRGWDAQMDEYGDRREYPGLDWVVVGGESGDGARPMHPDWARSLRDQCKASKVPFFFKQWGSWAPTSDQNAPLVDYSGRQTETGWVKAGDMRSARMVRMGKHDAGRVLDGQTHTEFPAFD